MPRPENTLHVLRDGLDLLTEEYRRAVASGDAVQVRDLLPMITRSLKDIRVEEEKQGLLLSLADAQRVFREQVDQVIESVWRHAPSAAPEIVQDVASCLEA